MLLAEVINKKYRPAERCRNKQIMGSTNKIMHVSESNVTLHGKSDIKGGLGDNKDIQKVLNAIPAVPYYKRVKERPIYHM